MQAVASYFNPIKLAENARSQGHQRARRVDPRQGGGGRASIQSLNRARAYLDKPPPPRIRRSRRTMRGEALFRDPYAVLAEIAGAPAAHGERAPALDAEEDGLKGGEAYRDPFDPVYWQMAPRCADGEKGAWAARTSAASRSRRCRGAGEGGARARPKASLTPPRRRLRPAASAKAAAPRPAQQDGDQAARRVN